MTTYPERVLQQAYAWTRGHPRAADAVLAVAVLGAGADQVPAQPAHAAPAIVVNVLLAISVAARRRDPVAAFSGAAATVAVQLAFGLGPGGAPGLEPGASDLAVVILLYTLAAYRPRRTSVTGLAICLAGATIAIARYAPLHVADARAVLLLTILAVNVTLLAAWVLGDSMAYRRAYYTSLEERLAVAERARDLEAKRARAIDDAAARLRGIERDLHDGAQVRLAALAMALGEIKENLAGSADTGSADTGGDETLKLVSAAHQNAKDTLAELRDLARGIHPPVLDRGLRAALAALAETSPVPVDLTVDVTGRPSPAIEAITYFCAAELLANTAKHGASAKHSAATRATIRVAEEGTGLVLTAADDGPGGARVVPGGGLAGLVERVQTVDGRLAVESPPGGPTTVTIGLPRHA